MARWGSGEAGGGKGRCVGSTVGHLRVTITMGHLRVTIGHLRVTIGHLWVTMGHLKVTVGHPRVTRVIMGHLGLT